mgnify:CR=1 FL=1
MNIVYKDIIIRDYKEEDIIDGIRWMNEEIAWHEWDAPWESEEDLNNFDAEKYYQKAMEKLKDKKDDSEFRRRFEIDTKYGIHIGRVNSYLNDEEYNWKSASQGGCLHTLGIDICESAYWHKGYGTQAFIAFIQYHLSREIVDIYTETWSGNYPMIAMARKIGFEECNRERNLRVIRGNSYDGLTFKLNIKKFEEFLCNY